jgi:hypothetical protein
VENEETDSRGDSRGDSKDSTPDILTGPLANTLQQRASIHVHAQPTPNVNPGIFVRSHAMRVRLQAICWVLLVHIKVSPGIKGVGYSEASVDP